MKSVRVKLQMALACFTIALMGMLVVSGCADDSAVDSQADVVLTANKDISESVAAAIAEDNGGVIDQVADLAAIAGGADSLSVAKKALAEGAFPEYDSATNTWQLHISRERGGISEPFHATFTRTYRYQFFNRFGEPQKQWLVGVDTAYSIHFEILEGSGQCHTLRYSQCVTSMNGSLVATGINADTIIINGTCSRIGIDTLTGDQSVRRLQYQLALAFSNVRCLRSQFYDVPRQVSGSLSGIYTATVSFMSGYAYGETSLNRNMAIAMGDGQAAITIGGDTYIGDLVTGGI